MKKRNLDNISDQKQADETLPNLAEKKLELSKNNDGFLQYVREIQKFPILTAKEEYDYAMRFKETGDKEAAKMLVQSHLRLVVKMASKFRNYGLPITDLVSEGNVGLIQAVKKFDPEKGFRFSTYAMWWIRANIQEYVLRSWSLVKIGTTVAQRKLFFNLHKLKKRLKKNDENYLRDEHITQIADELNVEEKEVRDMDSRLSHSDTSLNNLIHGSDDTEMVDEIAAAQETQEQIAIDNQEKLRREQILHEAFSILNEREKDILVKRQMSEVSSTLEELSKDYNISRERIRQIEQSALEKLKKEILKLSKIKA